MRHPPIALWHALTKPEHLYYWFGDAGEVDLRVGGAYIVRSTFGIRLDTTVERLVEGRRLVLRPTRRGDDARIEFDLVKLSGAETRVCVADPDSENEEPWRAALENLRSVWEQGVDLREAQVAAMGVGPRDISPAERPMRGVPAGLGVCLGAVLAGGPAEKAGLKAGDIVISFDGEAVRNGQDLVDQIRRRKPGDVISCDAVRDGAPISASVTLGTRTGRGEPPPHPDRLVGALRSAVLEADAKLERAVDGLPDEDAYRPERPGAWSVAQLLAHLSITERMLQSWLDEAGRGGRPGIDSDSCTSPVRIAAVLEARPTIRDLLQRIFLDEEETIALIVHFPDSVASFKPRWGRVAFTALDFHSHSEDHLGQIARIRKAIGA
ncbi:MAG TPA: PDZ domain-containing protein [Candidatus Angelobacter sp.]|nr:PDZ domain-containing protein [Candidatus Angelobacter sp.]